MKILNKHEYFDVCYKLDVRFVFAGKLFRYEMHSNFSNINKITLKDLAYGLKNTI